MTISIPCPECGAVLKLRDSSLFGKTGKCPKCEHRFVLRDPDEVDMELVEAPAPRASRSSSSPKVGTGAQWVPDHPPSSAAAAPAAAPVEFGGVETAPPVRSKRGRKKRSLPQLIALGAGLIMVCVGAFWGVQTFAPGLLKSQPVAGKKAKPHKSATKVAAASEDEQAAARGEPGSEPDGPSQFGRPTHGKPIDLLLIPSGARVIISLRPADLWKAGALGEGEFIAGLGPLGQWLGTWMTDSLMAKPSEIDEVLICLIPGSRGTVPDVAAVVHRHKDHKFKKSEMIEKFAGQSMQGKLKYYANDKRALVLQSDMQTYAICPVGMAAEMVDASENPNPTDGGIEELLLKTDRDLQFTVVCVPADLKIHGEFLAPANAQPFLQNVADWISSDDEAEAVAWSFHITEQKFYTQLLARNSAVVKAHQLAKSFKNRLAATPRRILETIEMMNPPQAGSRKVIGRVPAMTKVVQLGTNIETGPRYVSLSYAGPERAAPNLALGTLLAWDESTRTNFSASPGGNNTAAAGEQRKPLRELLRTKIDVDFRRAELQDAYAYIAGEAKFELVIDGDALKSVGYTKNMPQTFKAEGITASAALAMIPAQSKQDAMCFVIDEAKGTVTVTTKQKATDTKLTIYEMK